MADEHESEEPNRSSTPSRRRERWRKNGPTRKAEVLALGPKAAAAYAAQVAQARKKQMDTSEGESSDTKPDE